jgi:hypothetical protein
MQRIGNNMKYPVVLQRFEPLHIRGVVMSNVVVRKRQAIRNWQIKIISAFHKISGKADLT